MSYTFTSKNVGDVTISIFGEYCYDTYAYDVSVSVENPSGDELYDEFEEINDACEVFQWLVDNGVEFESDRSMVANFLYVQSVMFDHDMTDVEVWRKASEMGEDEVGRWVAYIFG